MSLKLDKLKDEAEKLVKLLNDEEGKGMATWMMFLHERLTNLHALCHDAGVCQYEEPNPFELYESKTGWEEATQEIKAELDKLLKLKIGQESVYNRIIPLMEKYQSLGATDTASREAVWSYIQEKLK